ncbi:PQQ-binding-like beta-propeller repeat protein [Paenibacillus thailandensis]|uniref:PQQ-binding-like beta-propeller repeat protein n=1 Tax=Paenibacillus thailandensis TaxID=393250 RepID=A0ABW5QT69_9BACL
MSETYLETANDSLPPFSNPAAGIATLPLSSPEPIASQGAAVFRAGESVTLKAAAPVWFGNPDVLDKGADDYGEVGDVYTVSEASGDFLAAKSFEQGDVWLPAWYASDEARTAYYVHPSRIWLKSGSNMHIAPNSSRKLGGDDNAWFSVMRWNDWIGLMLESRGPYPDERRLYPYLLWVRDVDVQKEEKLQEGLMAASSSLPTGTAKHFTEAMLYRGMEAAAAAVLLGEPDIIEPSESLTSPPEPLRTGESWRYERPDGHLIASFSKQGKLERVRWLLPSGGEEDIGYSFYRDLFQYERRAIAFPPSVRPKVKWSRQYDLNFNFLLGANGNTLLLKGDDGGFSGMHNASAIFAVDRESGDKLWQIDAGFGGSDALLSASGDAAAVLTRYDPGRKEYVTRLRQVGLRDGKVKWVYEPGNDWNEEYSGIAGTKGAIVFYGNDGITAINDKDGTILWQRRFSETYEVLNGSRWRAPYVLALQGRTLLALNPMTGKTAWTFEDIEPALREIVYGSFVLEPEIDLFRPSPIRRKWLLLGRDFVWLDLQSGKELSRYPMQDERVTAIGDGYLLIERQSAGPDNENRTYTELYDGSAGRKLWSLEGKGGSAAIEGNRIYLIWNGAPASLRLSDGKPVWRMPIRSEPVQDIGYPLAARPFVLKDTVLFPYGSDLLQVGKSDGAFKGRVGMTILGYPDLRENEQRNGMINADRGGLYIGGGNGYFMRLENPEG